MVATSSLSWEWLQIINTLSVIAMFMDGRGLSLVQSDSHEQRKLKRKLLWTTVTQTQWCKQELLHLRILLCCTCVCSGIYVARANQALLPHFLLIRCYFCSSVFLLGTPSHIYKFLAPSVKEKESWEQKLKECITQAKDAITQVKNP